MRVQTHSQIKVELSAILLDTINPRHDPIPHQVELIKVMVDTQKDKVVRLAESIVRHGLNPSDLISVIPHPTEKDKYTVVEGNRRITALKLLNLPSLCHDDGLRKRFELLNREYAADPIGQFNCICFLDREAAKYWISLKHTGQNAGVGTVEWDSTSVKRFQAQGEDKKESIGLQLMNFLLKNLQLDPQSRDIVKKMPITTVERLLNDPQVRSFLGLHFEGGILNSTLTKEVAAQSLYDFFFPIATGEKKVTEVYYKDNRKEYMKSFGPSPASDPENLSDKNWSLISPPEKPTQKPGKVTTTIHVKSKPVTAKRKYVIPQSCVIKINVQRINNMYDELKNELVVEYVPNACAVLLRVFLEVSIDEYIAKQNITVGKSDDLKTKMLKVAEFMESNGISNRNELKPVRNSASIPNGLFSTHTLNAYVHNPNVHPKASELKSTWDEMEGFIKKIWGS